MTNGSLLARYLDHQLSDRVLMTFEDMEDTHIIGVTLPLAAKSEAHWWTDEASNQSRVWLDVAWEVRGANLNKGYVIFQRVADAEGVVAQASLVPTEDEPHSVVDIAPTDS
jgi:hypothetical protein